VEELPKFAYELRKVDLNDGYYTKHFLKDIVKQKLILEIILSNKWNPRTKKMESKDFYTLNCGKKYKYMF